MMTGAEGPGMAGILKLLGTVAQNQGFLNAYFLSKKVRENRQLDILSDAELVRRLNPGKEVELRIENGVHTVVPVERHLQQLPPFPAPAQLAEGGDIAQLAGNGDVRLWETFVHQHRQEQGNVEAVLEHAAEEVLSQADAGIDASDVPVDQTWAKRFFGSAKHVSDPEMQRFWGRLLASEVITPGSFSTRTVRAVEGLTPEIAQLFEKVAQSVLVGEVPIQGKTVPHSYFIPIERWKLHDVKYKNILDLSHYELISTDTSTYKIKNDTEDVGLIKCGDYHLLVETPSGISDIKLSVRFLTVAGSELLALVRSAPDLDYANKVARKIHELKASVRVASGILPTDVGVGWRTIHTTLEADSS